MFTLHHRRRRECNTGQELIADVIVKFKGDNETIPSQRYNFNNGSPFQLQLQGHAFEEKYLELDGSFCPDFELQIYQLCDVWYPKNSPPFVFEEKDDTDANADVIVVDDVLGMMFRSPKFSDMSFIVGSNKKEFKAHSCVLAIRAKTLLEWSLKDDDDDDDDDNDCGKIAVVIPGLIDENNFEIILRYVYTKELEQNPKTEEDAMALFELADRFGITDLKIYIESVIVDAFLSTDNAGKMLSFADSYSCAYLKEASMDKFVEDPIAVYNSSYWVLISESCKLLSELLQYTTIDRVFRTTNNNSVSVDHLPVSSLRERLEEKKLELDGSRKILVDRMNSYL
jgi:hypothetical protein